MPRTLLLPPQTDRRSQNSALLHRAIHAPVHPCIQIPQSLSVLLSRSICSFPPSCPLLLALASSRRSRLSSALVSRREGNDDAGQGAKGDEQQRDDVC